MRRNDRLSLLLAFLGAAAGTAKAAQPVAQPAPSASMPTAAEVRAVGLGAKSEPVPTLKEWTELQTRVQMKAMRDALAGKSQGAGLPTLAADQVPVATPATPAAPGAGASAVPPKAPPIPSKDAAPVVATKPTTFDEEWTARNALAGVRWVNTLNVGGIVRAEVVILGVNRVVAEGDEVLGWTVGAIKPGRVEMSRTVNRVAAFPGATPQAATIRAELVPALDLPSAPAVRPSGMPPTAGMRPPALPPGLNLTMPKPDSTAMVTPPPLAAR